VILTYLDQLGHFVSRFTPDAPDAHHVAAQDDKPAGQPAE